MMERKTKGQQKHFNEKDSKKQSVQKKKESLKKLQETSKLLLKRNLRIKALQTKNIGRSSPFSTINSDSIIEQKSVSCLSKFKSMNNDTIINKLKIKDTIDIDSVPLECSSELILYKKTEDISDNVINNSVSLQEDIVDVKFQKALRDYRSSKNVKREFNKNFHPIKEVEGLIENETKMICIKSGEKTEKVCFPTFPSQKSVDYPYNFITAVKKKLNKALNSPVKRKDDRQSSRIFKTKIDKFKDSYQDFSTKPSFINLYNVTPVHAFIDSAYSKPRSHTSETNFVKYFDSSNNTSCEVSLYKKSSNVTSLSEYPSESKIKTQSAVRTSTVISELKSSLEEIQNLTVSITFNGLRDNQSFSTNKISGSVDKNVPGEYKLDTSVDESHLHDDDQCNFHTVKTQTKDEPVPVNILNPPDINLIWLRNHSSSENNDSEHKRRKSNKYATPDLLHKSFENELNLLESFNKSLQQVQSVEQTLTSIRDDKLSDINTTQIGNCSENSPIYSNFSTTKTAPPMETSNNKDLKQNEHFVAMHTIHNLSSSNDKCFESNSNSDISTPFTIKNNGMTSEILTQIFENKNASNFINVKNIEPKSRNKNIVYSQREYVNQKISVKHSLSHEDDNSIVSLNESSSTGMSVDISSSHYYAKNDFNIVGQLNRFCVCLVNQYIEDEKARSEYINNLLKVREKNLLDATRNELSSLEMQKKQNLDQIPFLKKKQRGLVLKLQQERNEIKHIKKFQQEQSQERKMALRRQLKYLKRMFAYEESLLDIKKKTHNFKNSSFILQSNRSTQNSPFKGINISLSSSTNTMNSSFSKLKESLHKKRMDLIEQKKKMHELLQIQYNIQLDTAEIKAMEHELRNPCSLDELSESRNYPCKYINADECTKNNLTNGNSNLIEKVLHNEKSCSNEYGKSQIYNNIIPQENSLNECVLSGSTLNNLWEKITGKKCEKYVNSNNYVMSKKSLDVFFADAKQIAIQDLLKSLEYDTKIDNSLRVETDLKKELANTKETKIDNSLRVQTDLKKELANTEETNLDNYDILNQENQSNHSLCPETVKSSPNLIQTCEDYSVKSNDTPVTDNTVNYLNSTKILNNLLQSQSHDLEELRKHKDSCNNKLGNNNLQSSQIDKESSDISIIHENVLSETFTIDRNSSDSCDQSDASKSTAHSLIEELTYTDITKLNECCENENINLIQAVPVLSFSKENIKCNVDIQTDNISFLTCNKQNITEIPVSEVEGINILTNQSKKVITPDSTFLDTASVILSGSPYKEKNSKIHGDHLKISNKEINKIDIESKMFSPKLKDKANKGLKKFQVSFKSDGLFDHSDNKNKSLSVKMPIGNKCLSLKPANDALCTSSVEICSKDTDFKSLYVDEKAELHSKITSLIEGKSPIYSQLIIGSWEATSPSPEPSPRDSPTGEYSPASAVTLPICQVDEAEELRKKQLAIELEIKALEQQSQISYCLVREIPDKPPPPYTPPTEENKLAVSLSPRNLIRKPVSKVFNMIESCSSWLWLKFTDETSDPKNYSEFCKYDNTAIDLNNSLFLFEICREIFEDEFADHKSKKIHIWEYQQVPKVKSMNKFDVCLRVQNKVKEELSLEFWPSKDNHIIPRPHKRQDYLSELLTKELYQEESSWSNFELYENKVKNDLTVTILNSLIIETCREYKSLFLLN